jgi:transcriptional regulator with XRE-family HTH domain
VSKAIFDLGMLVREYRIKADMTQLELAKKLGYDSVQFVSLFERSLAKVPLETIGQLIVILGIPEEKIRKNLIATYENEVRARIANGKIKAKEVS